MKSLFAESSSKALAADMALRDAVGAARQRSLDWFASMQAPGQPQGVLRSSAAHDIEAWPGMLLPGTYNGIMGQALLGGLEGSTTTARQALASWLLRHRRDDGIFRIPGMRDGAVYKKPDIAETWRYIDFHVTNYSLGALEVLDACPLPALPFAEPYIELQHLHAWLALRDLRDPWLEGNNIVNLGSFLLQLRNQDAPYWQQAVDLAMQSLFDWHDRLQDPTTGFWGVAQHANATQLLHAMAGSMHNYHLWYATGRPLPFQDKAVDYCLSQPPKVHSACIDVDLVDLMVHAHAQADYRRAEIRGWLRRLLPELLAFQNADGGFADVRDGPGVPARRQDGWVLGYAEPQGLSNTFATWFRWVAIAMIAACLWPDWCAGKGRWRFRRMVGIGYCQPAATRYSTT